MVSLLTLIAPPSADAASTLLFRFRDPRIVEASGIALGHRSPGVVYVENDSGDVNRFFAVERRDGATAAVVTIPGATNVDWEDIASGPDAAGTPSVWLADIGDNGADRREVDVYRVDEPVVAPDARDQSVTTGRPDVWRLRYSQGPADAESLAVAPDGTAYIVTKSLLGRSTVYRLPTDPDARRIRTVRPVGYITLAPQYDEARLAPSVDGYPLGSLASQLVTSAGISTDGSLLVVRTYTDVEFWRLRDADVPAGLRAPPAARVVLPAQPQGEGVVFDGARLLIDSEGVHSAVYAVPVPAALLRAVPAAPTSAAGTSGAASRAGAGSPGGRDHVTALLAAAAAVLVLSVLTVLSVRAVRGRTRRRPAHRPRPRPGPGAG